MITVSKGGTTLASTTSSQEELVGALGADVAEVEVEDTNAAPAAATTEASEEESAEQAENASESETEQQETEQQRDETGKFKPKGGFQKKIDKLTRRASELQSTLEEERLARQRLEAQLAGRTTPAAGAPKAEAAAAVDVEPDEDKPNPKTGKPWTDWKEFSREHAAWSYRQAQKEASAETTKQTEQSELKQKFDAHVGRVKAAQEKYDDWDTAAAALQGDDAQIPEAAGLAIIEQDNGADVLYHLAKHPELRAKLRGMSDVGAVAEIGRLAASLPAAEKTAAEKTAAAAAGSPNPKPKSNAPAPIRPVGGANANTTPDPMKLPLSDYIKRRNKGDVR